MAKVKSNLLRPSGKWSSRLHLTGNFEGLERDESQLVSHLYQRTSWVAVKSVVWSHSKALQFYWRKWFFSLWNYRYHVLRTTELEDIRDTNRHTLLFFLTQPGLGTSRYELWATCGIGLQGDLGQAHAFSKSHLPSLLKERCMDSFCLEYCKNTKLSWPCLQSS